MAFELSCYNQPLPGFQRLLWSFIAEIPDRPFWPGIQNQRAQFSWSGRAFLLCFPATPSLGPVPKMGALPLAADRGDLLKELSAQSNPCSYERPLPRKLNLNHIPQIANPQEKPLF